MLYNGDCLEVMKDLDDNSVDTIITDPPYGVRIGIRVFLVFRSGVRCYALPSLAQFCWQWVVLAPITALLVLLRTLAGKCSI